MIKFKHLIEISLIFAVSSLIYQVNSLFPEPAGPFYGFPFSTKVARAFPIPATAYGKCQQGQQYHINSTQDLRKYDSELQCIFSAGITPSKVPEGPTPGRVLLALNSRHFLINPLVTFLWRGNFAFKAECNATTNKTEIYVGFHNAFNRAYLPTILYISPLKGNFAPGECEDKKASVVMDFTQDLTKICPDYDEFVERNKSDLPTRVKNLVNLYPQTQVLDVFRLVGRQKDGAKIFLGKTYLKDYYRSDKQLATIAFWYLTSYDEGVNPEFQVEEALPPLEKSYSYTFPGVVDIIFRYLPFDNFVSRPFATFWRLNEGFYKTGRSAWLSYKEYLRHIGRARANRRRLRKYFKDDKLKAGSIENGQNISLTTISNSLTIMTTTTETTLEFTTLQAKSTKVPTILEKLSESKIILADIPDVDIRKFVN